MRGSEPVDIVEDAMTSPTYHRYLVIGAGPAGLQLAYHLQQAGRDYLVLERGHQVGAFFETFPRHRTLLSINKVYTGQDDPEVALRWDWNSLLSHDPTMRFTAYSRSYFPQADDLVRYLGDYARRFDLNVSCDSTVTRVSKDAGGFRVVTEDNRVFECDVLVVATGLFKPYVPDVPGIELVDSYTTVSVDPEEFVNQRVLIIGKGNSAFETADRLVSTAAMIHLASPNPVRMAWKTHYPGHLRAVNNSILETYRLKSQNSVINGMLRKISRDEDGTYRVAFSFLFAEGEEGELEYERIISCTGFRFDDSIFDESCRPELTTDNRLPALTNGWRSTNVPDLYFAGTAMQARENQKAASAFIHGFRYNVRSLHNRLESLYEGHPLPSRRLPRKAEAIGQANLDRVNTASCLWQQFGYLCDLVVVDDARDEAIYYEELPVDYARELGADSHHYTVTLEYGTDQGCDPFATNRIHKNNVAEAEKSAFLHPVIRQFRNGTLTGSHHVIEDLLTEWRGEVHVAPLHKFLDEQLSGLPA